MFVSRMRAFTYCAKAIENLGMNTCEIAITGASYRG
jgi:hypothetical protein